MKNKLFLSLSLLTMAFSQINALGLSENVKNQLAKPFAYAYLASTSVGNAFSLSENAKNQLAKPFAYAYLASTSKAAQSAKVAVVALPAAVVAGGIYALDRLQTQTQATETLSKFERVKAALSNAGTYVANTRVANTLVAAGSSVKTNVQAHPRIATGAGLVTVAGLSYLAYNKFGKATLKKAETKAVVTATPKKAVVSAPVKAKKAKRFKKRK